MSQVGQKRKRPSQTPDLFHTAVQSILAQAAHQDLETRPTHQPLPLSKTNHTSVPLRRNLLSALCDRLDCISRQTGLSALSALTENLRKRTHGIADLVSALFSNYESDDVEMMPPLCVTLSLLRDRTICLADIPYTYFVHRAVFELRNSDVCDCRGSQRGFLAVVHYLLDGNRSSSCDALLRHFIAIFFQDTDPALSHIEPAARYRLANFVIQCIYAECARHGEFLDIMTHWTQQAVTPSRFLDRPLRDKSHVIWTPELSGLATGRKVEEYLSCGTSEKDALISLFKTIPLETSSKIYLQAVSDVLEASNVDGEKKDPIVGTWSRLVLLGYRITDKKTYPDVDENLRRSVVSSITGTLCSPSCYGDFPSIAVMLCLARRVLISQGELAGSDHSQALERYFSWFRDLIANSDVLVIKSLLEPLVQLVPLESLHFLKLNHRVFAVNKRHFHVASDYVKLVRSRIQDFDPAFSRIGRVGDDAGDDSRVIQNGEVENVTPNEKVIKEVISFVIDFSKANGKLPPGLIRQMNFHRYHFQKVTLPVFLHADFATLQGEDGDEIDLDMDPQLFDERRIDIIHELAFKRKDQAISKADGKAAIKAIKATNKKRDNNQKNGAKNRVQKLASAKVEQSSKLSVVMEAILKDEAEHGFNATQVCKDGAEVRKAKDLLCSNIVSMVSKCKKDKEKLALVSLEILQGLCSAIESVEGLKGHLYFPEATVNEERLLPKYNAWWKSTGRSLLWLMSNVIGDKRLAGVHAHMRCHLFSLICYQMRSLSEQTVQALAKIITVLVALQGKCILCDLCFVLNSSNSTRLSHVALITFESLRLCTSDYVVVSTLFAVECVFLLNALTESGLIGIDTGFGDNYIALESRGSLMVEVRPISEFAQPLMHFLRWIVYNPWRMNETPCYSLANKNAPNNGTKTLISARQVFLKVLRAQRELATSGSTSNSQGSVLEDLLPLEVRCGWGRKTAMDSFFRKLVGSGVNAIDIIHKTTAFLTREMAKGGDRKTDWIRSGLIIFHDKLHVGPREIKNEESAAFQVEQCIKREGPYVAFYLIEHYHFLNFDYFRGCQGIDTHIRQVFVNLYWPLPKRLILYVVRCLKRISFKNCHVSSNIFFIANCALVFDDACEAPERMLNGSKENGHKRRRDGFSLEYKVTEISTVLQFLTDCSTSGINNNPNSGLDDRYNSSCTSSGLTRAIANVGFDHAFALGIAIGMYLGMKEQGMVFTTIGKHTVPITDEVKHLATSIGEKVGKVACCDVLDCAILACGMLPFGRVDDHDEDVRCINENLEGSGHINRDNARDKCARETSRVLSALVDERVTLCGGDGRLSPFWARDTMKDGGWKKRTGSGDAREILECWDEVTSCRCTARVLSALGFLDDKAMHRFITGIGREQVLSAVIPNLLWAFLTVKSVHGAFGSTMRTGIIRAFRKLLALVDDVVDGGVLSSISGRLGAIGVEIINLLQSGNYN